MCEYLVLSVSRDNNLKIPKKIEVSKESKEDLEDEVQIKKAIINVNKNRV